MKTTFAFGKQTVKPNLSFYIPAKHVLNFLKMLVLYIGLGKWFWELSGFQYSLILCRYWATYCSQGSLWLELLSAKAFLPIGPHTPPFHFPPREEEDRLTFLPVWIWATVELRWRIIFFLNIVIFEWGSFHFNLNILIFNDMVIVLYGGRR